MIMKDAHHPRYTPLAKVPGDAILTAGAKRFADSKDNAARLDINRDSSARTRTPRNRSATLKPPISKTFPPSV